MNFTFKQCLLLILAGYVASWSSPQISAQQAANADSAPSTADPDQIPAPQIPKS